MMESMGEQVKNMEKNVAKMELEKYEVNYEDSTNFIYVYNKKSIKEFRDGEKWNYDGILELYMRSYEEKEINCDGLEMTSFPIYPNMKMIVKMKMNVIVKMNKLTSFPVQPNMREFSGNNNKLTSFPVQPNMTEFHGHDNKMSTFPVQPVMDQFHGCCNKLTSFPVQPMMTFFEGNDNKLTSFPVQPEMIEFEGNVKFFRGQPKMERFNGQEYDSEFYKCQCGSCDSEYECEGYIEDECDSEDE